MPSNTNQPECPVKLVPNTLGKQLGLTVCWVKEHQFASLAFSNVKNHHASQRKQPAPGAGSRPPAVDIQHFDVDLVLEEPTIRSMVSECGRLFYQLQQLRYGLTGRQTQTIDFVDQSLRYRTIVRQALEKLNRLLNELSQTEAQEDHAPSYHTLKSYQDLVALFYSIECTWHLLEFLLLDSNNSTTIVAPLLEWIRHHYPTPALDAAELLSSGRQIDLPENYWSVVKALILQGQTTIARALLRLHVAADTQSFSTVDQLLHSFPIYTVYGGLSVHKFRSQWNCWTSNVRTLLATGHFADEPNLEELLRLVTGDRQAWKQQLSSSGGAWYEHFPGFLLYTDSTCKYYELPEHVNEWMELFREAHSLSTGTSNNTLLDNLVLAVMENDLIKLLHQIQQLPDNGWFAVHLVDLLYHAGQLDLGRSRLPDEDATGEGASVEDGLVDNGKLMRESLLYEFGTILMTHRTLWQLGMDYLEFSNTLGLGAREVLLGRIPLRNEREALKVFAVARKNGYRGIATEVCKVQSRRYLALKRYGSALDWANKSGDGGCISEVANIFLEYYCNHGELLCEETIANLDSEMFLSSRLMFLKKYHDFRKYYRDQAYASAAELLVSLMDSKIMPSYFWPCLMSDAIPLLEFKEPIIPSKETLIILEHLQLDLVPMLQRRQQQRKSAETSSGSMPGQEGTNASTASQDVADEMALVPKFASNLLNNCTEDLIKMLRLACARNLSRALIIENTIST
ncbi:Nup75 [Anopheles darlingi]|uniref:Nuclear pore complex protein Nup85 n=1 Tax=Anopheles darlingi TaxID=43151 RepID=W5JI90_ANODA|nr:nuclear pore complex protein Nup75 [Anopheles darlingi]ETN63003.1 Nup75 [Anopheles darlingi]